jgi:hypothetical protein
VLNDAQRPIFIDSSEVKQYVTALWTPNRLFFPNRYESEGSKRHHLGRSRLGFGSHCVHDSIGRRVSNPEMICDERLKGLVIGKLPCVDRWKSRIDSKPVLRVLRNTFLPTFR